MYHYVYQITNLLNNMIYVGKRSSKKHPDIDTYFGSGVHLKPAIKKYGKENFKKEIISILDTVEEAEELEETIVDTDFISRKDTYNLVIGGQKGTRGLRHSDVAKAKLSEANKGKKLSEEQKAKISAAMKGTASPNKGKKLSEETKAKMSQPKSEETKTRMAAAKKGKQRSEETKAKLSEANKGKTLSKNHKVKISDKMKGRVYINNGKISKRVKPDEIDNYTSSGFVIGKL